MDILPDDVLHQPSIEGLAGEVNIVLLRQLLLYILVLQAPQVVALLLKALDDFSHQGPLNAIRLDLYAGSGWDKRRDSHLP